MKIQGVEAGDDYPHFVDVVNSQGLSRREFYPDALFLAERPFFFLPLLGIGESFALFPHLLGLAIAPVQES
jgi:hypothetical protein